MCILKDEKTDKLSPEEELAWRVVNSFVIGDVLPPGEEDDEEDDDNSASG